MKRLFYFFFSTIFLASCTSDPETFQLAKATLKPPVTTTAGSDATDSAAALLAKKKRSIWLVGGSKATGTAVNPPAYAVAEGAFSKRLDYYDPQENNWGTVYDPAYSGCGSEGVECYSGTYTPVLMACYAGYNGKIYVVGGLQENNTFNSSAPTNLVQIYDIENNSWSTGSNMPLAVSAASCAQQKNYIYVHAGSTANANAFTLNNAGNIIMRYDMSSNSWGSIAAGAAPAAPANATASTEACMVSDGFSLYKINGKTAAATLGAVASFAAYNVFAGAYGNITFQAPAVLRVGASCLWLPATADIPARIISIGGLGGANLAGNTTAISIFYNTGVSVARQDTFFYYSPYQSAAVAGTNLPAARSHGAAAVKGKTMYYFGGNSAAGAIANPTPTNNVYAADVELPFWLNKIPFTTTNIPTMPEARWGHGAVTVE